LGEKRNQKIKDKKKLDSAEVPRYLVLEPRTGKTSSLLILSDYGFYNYFWARSLRIIGLALPSRFHVLR